MELLKRESFLDALAEYAREARRGDGRLILVSGESGIGKTALLEAFQQQLKGVPCWGGRATGCRRRVRSGRRQLAERRDVDAAELYRITGGNPFYVSEMLDGRPCRRRSATLSARGWPAAVRAPARSWRPRPSPA